MMYREWLMITFLMKKANLGGSTPRRGINEETTNNKNDIGTKVTLPASIKHNVMFWVPEILFINLKQKSDDNFQIEADLPDFLEMFHNFVCLFGKVKGIPSIKIHQ